MKTGKAFDGKVFTARTAGRLRRKIRRYEASPLEIDQIVY